MIPWRVRRQIYNYSRQQSYQRIRWNICRWIPRISLTIGLRKDTKECETWHIVAREFGNLISLGSLAMEVVTARRRLDTLCRPK